MLEKDLAILAVELPEDILKAKWCGDFTRALRLIDQRCALERTPRFLKKRLQAEKEVLLRLPLDYGYGVPEAVALVQKDIPDFTEAELQRLMDESKADWIYIDGKPHLATRFYETLKDVNPDIAARAARGRGESIGENQAQNADFEETPNSRLKNFSMHYISAHGGRSDYFRIRATLRITDEAFRPGRVLVHLPIPKPQINMTAIRILRVFPEDSETCKVTIAPEDAPARTVSWEATITENTTIEVEYEYISTINYKDLRKQPQDTGRTEGSSFDSASSESDAPGRTEGSSLASALAEASPHLRFTPTIRALAAELIENLQKAEPDLDLSAPEGRLKTARAFYNYCTTNVTYSYTRNYFTLEQIPEYAALGQKGDCGVQALLFITLCRSVGIPARWQSGLYVTPAFEGMEADSGMHDWAQFYIEGYGWLFADPSFGGSAYRAGNQDRWNYYFGNLDTFRMAANSEFQAPFTPPKRFTRRDPYDNQMGEAEYEDRPLLGQEVVRTAEVSESYQVH